MIKAFKNISLFLALLLIVILLSPKSVSALSDTTSYKNINENTKINIGDVSLNNVNFKNWSNTSIQAFGLSGSIYNGYNTQIEFRATVNYYDKNYNLVATTYDNQTVSAGQYNSYSQMSNLSELKFGYSANDICYYVLSIEVNTLSEDTLTSSSTPSSISKYNNYSYVIDKYDVNIVVNENNTYDITEKITAYFNVSKHGIYRTIPLKNTVTRTDGSTSTNIARISNISVDNEFTTSRSNGNHVIKIGSANRTLTGKQSYVIKYTYNIGKDRSKNFDEFYYNVIGNSWDAPIGNVTFNITMPKEFDPSKLGFSSGYKGSVNNSNIKYNVENKTITGSYNGILESGQGLTVRLTLEDGYYVDNIDTNIFNYLMFIIPVLCLIISFLLWNKYGKDEQVVETVEFYPPEGFNSLEVGYLYKGRAENKDVVSLLVYLANKGYVRISKIEGSKPKEFKITKLKEYYGDNKNEKLFLDGLFTKKESSIYMSANSDVVSNEVTSTDLYNHFYITMRKIISNINNKENKEKLFEKSTLVKSLSIIMMIIISLITIISIPTIEYFGIDELGMALFLILIYIPFYVVMFVKTLPKSLRLFWGGFTILHSMIMFSTMPIKDALFDNLLFLIGFLFGMVCILGMIFFVMIMPKRTPYGNEMLGKVRGFKNFLETAEKEKLEALVMQDPEYFYNILPYTYVLDVSDKWINKFEAISLQAPSWYDSPSTFDVATFGSFMNTTMTSASSAMSSFPTSSGGSSGGGSSGGGSSGGGSGGGGGGSW